MIAFGGGGPRGRQGLHAALLGALFVPLALLLAAPAPTQARTLDDAVYSPEQAKTGRRLYRKHCQSCHVEDYFQTVLRTWEGEPLSELFSVMAAIMPQDNPGSLRDQEYLDVLAYILSASGYPGGAKALGGPDLADIDIFSGTGTSP